MFKLKELRKKNNISQAKLAIEMNIAQNTISQYENEVRHADYDVLITIADFFDVSIDYLLGRTDNPKMNK